MSFLGLLDRCARLGSEREGKRSLDGRDTWRIGNGGGSNALSLKLSLLPKGVWTFSIAKCEKSGSDRETNKSQGGNETCRTGYGGGRSASEKSRPTKLAFPVADEIRVLWTMNCLLGLIMAVFCFLLHTSGDWRRKGTTGAPGDSSKECGFDLYGVGSWRPVFLFFLLGSGRMLGSHREEDKDEEEDEMVLATDSESLCCDLGELGPARVGLCETWLSTTIWLFGLVKPNCSSMRLDKKDERGDCDCTSLLFVVTEFMVFGLCHEKHQMKACINL